MGKSIGPSFKGIYQLVPPPGALGWSIKKGLKKAGRGIKKTGKVAVKVSTKPIKVAAKAGKYALRATAKLAAKPIIMMVGKLAGRRAKYLAYTNRKSLTPTLAERKAGGQYAFAKLRKAGPVGKLAVSILKFTGGVTAGGDSTLGGIRRDVSMCGLTGAEILAASGAIIAATKKIMGALNKPGEAPADPAAAAEQEQPTEDTQPVVESAEESDDE